MNKDHSILIGGRAGQGSRKAAYIIAKLLNKMGYETFVYNDYQSLVRGGHNFSQIRASEEEVLTHKDSVDHLLALDQKTIDEHEDQLTEEGKILYNEDEFSSEQGMSVSLEEVMEDANPVMANTALAAAYAKMIGADLDLLKKAIEASFDDKIEENLKIAEAAFEKAEQKETIEELNQEPSPLMTGNETLALGAAKAGLDLYMAYPMTPATGVLHYLAENKDELGVAVTQLENEVGVVNSAVGAAYTGARTMLGTSGGGFALMTEGLSLAVQNETPLVMVESQRTGPASGVPTYTEQADLEFILSAGHGDITKFTIAPGDAEEAYLWGGKALNLSWKYQTPSVLLIDKEISESIFSFNTEVLDEIEPREAKLWNGEDYSRYKDTEDGVSPLAFPGDEAVVKANSYEHDEFGLTVEDEDKVEKMKDKRERKFEKMREEVKDLEAVKTYGDGEKAIITWGSTKGAAKEATERLGFKMIQVVVLEPFPEQQFKEALEGVDKKALVEVNQGAQLGSLLNQYGIKVDKEVLKYDGRPFVPEEITNQLKEF